MCFHISFHFVLKAFYTAPLPCFSSFLIFRSVTGGTMMSQTAEVAPGAGNRVVFPTLMASHEKIVNDPNLFMECLNTFHSVLGKKYTVPVIGGRDLDLHVLYVEVTKRGGYDKVVADKKWREVSTVFNFSPTTSASYALRKHYFTLLHHFEQVYFFRHQVPILDKSSRSNFQAKGSIGAKFDCDYFVSLKMGSEVLNGVLYHSLHQAQSSSSKLGEQSSNTIVPYNPSPYIHPRQRSRRKRNGDPNHPKPNRSGYNFFFAEKHAMLKALYPHREREFTKMIGESWNNLSSEEKMVYQEYGVKDKERYQRELKEYKEGLMASSAINGD